MFRTLFLIALLLAAGKFSFAQVRATTESGNKVVLYDNGTWQYEEKSVDNSEVVAVVTEVIAVAAITIDSSRTFATDPMELFYLPSPRLTKFFGETGGNIRSKVKCSNNLGTVKVQLIWEFPILDAERYFGWFGEGTKVTFTLDDGQTVELLMGNERTEKRFEKSNYSMISNVSEPLTKMQIRALSEEPLRKVAVEWKKNPEEYNMEKSRILMDALPTVY